MIEKRKSDFEYPLAFYGLSGSELHTFGDIIGRYQTSGTNVRIRHKKDCEDKYDIRFFATEEVAEQIRSELLSKGLYLVYPWDGGR